MRRLGQALAATLMLSIAGPVLAADHERARQAVEAGEAKPLGDILAVIAAEHPGRALEADLIERQGRLVYRIKWLGDDGTVRDVTADAGSGELLQIR
jgi:uncharacterized membrane protein YkoI